LNPDNQMINRVFCFLGALDWVQKMKLKVDNSVSNVNIID